MANNIDTTKATGTGPIIDRIHEFDRFGINLGMERLEELLRLHGLLNRCRAWAKVNTGARHIFGLLAVDAIANEENRGETH